MRASIEEDSWKGAEPDEEGGADEEVGGDDGPWLRVAEFEGTEASRAVLDVKILSWE